MVMTKKISFHEATVIDFCKYDTKLKLQLEDVLVDGAKSNVTLEVSPIVSMTIDGETTEVISMGAEDGEVLSLECSDNSLTVIVEWHDFASGTMLTKSYKVFGGMLSISVD